MRELRKDLCIGVPAVGTFVGYRSASGAGGRMVFNNLIFMRAVCRINVIGINVPIPEPQGTNGDIRFQICRIVGPVGLGVCGGQIGLSVLS